MKYARTMMLAVAVLAMVAVTAQAAVVTGVTIDSYSSQFGQRTADHTIDQAGFDPATGYHTTHPETGLWLTNNTATGDITFDLGANYDLDDVTVWNYNETGYTNRSANAVTISIASSVSGAFTSLGSFAFTEGPGSATVNFGQVIDLTSYTAAGNARLVKFDITTNHGDTGYVGLSEVVFNEVPEPATMSLLGIGGLLALVRRRRK